MTDEANSGGYETSLGEHYVGKSFNPGGSQEVNDIKLMAATLIDYIHANGKDRLCSEIAVKGIESAAMWAVKSVTKQPRL